MSSGRRATENTCGRDEERMYANDLSRPANVPHKVHADSKYVLRSKEIQKRSSAVEQTSPPPCPGSRASSADSMPITSQNSAQLKDDIIKEIKTEVAEPIRNMFSNIIDEIKTLKLKLETVKSCKDVSGKSDSQGNNNELAESDTYTIHFTERDTNPAELGESKDVSNLKEGNIFLNFADESDLIIEKKPSQCLFDPETPELHTKSIPVAVIQNPVVPLPRNGGRSHTSPAKQTLPQRMDISRSNSFHTSGQIVQVKPRPKSEVHPTRVHTADQRECLANALQYHVEDIVDGLVFHENDLPDCLVTEGCLTEDEYSSVRKLHDRKDQIRLLLSLIKGRDLHVLEGFMKHMKQQNQAVAEKVVETFESNMRNGFNGKFCALCKLKRQFNVKHVADSLWSIQAIDDGLYNKIVYSDAPLGAQSALWEKIILCLNCLNHENAELAHMKLLAALGKHNLFKHLEKEIDQMLFKNHGKLTCSCEPKLSFVNMVATSDGSVVSDSSSLASSSFSNDLYGRKNVSASVWEITKISKETDKLTGQERECHDNLLRPPALPKRPSFSKKSTMDNPSPKTTSVESFVTSKDELAVSMTENPQVGPSLEESFHKFSSKHALDSNAKLHTPKENGTSTPLPGSPTKDSRKLETRIVNPTISGIPPLPVKKNKYPALKKADEQGPSYV